MKQNTLLKKVFLGFLCTGIAGAFSVTAWAQLPTVTVTGGTVVVPGTGGDVLLNIVGNGGVVTMPDPGSGSFTIDPNGTTLLTWSLLGDLSFDDYPAPINQSISATTSATTIYSFNKNPRQSEQPSTLARSKGRVYISYAATCSGGISFDILKEYDDSDLPIIIGPECWLPDSTYTYSVDQIASDNLGDGIGIDKYYWTIKDKDGLLIYDSEDDAIPPTYPDSYTSADRSSITTKVPNPLESPYTITCCFGRANPWDGDGVHTSLPTHTSCVTKIIGSEPQEPVVLFQDPDTCVAVGASSFAVSIDTNDPSYDPSYTYSWSSNNPTWQFTPATGTSTIMAPNLGDLGGEPGKIILSVNNPACGQVKQFEYNVHRSFVAPVVTIVGPDDCLVPGEEYIFQIDPATAHQNIALWTPPTGWTIVNSNTPAETIITLAVPPGETVGTYPLSVVSKACPNSSVSIDVYVKPTDPVFQTAGGDSPECVDYNATSPVTYTVSASPGATGYSWTFPAGWTPASATTSTPTVNVTPASNGAATGTVSVVALGDGTCHSESVDYPISYYAIKPDGIPNNLCWNFGLQATTVVTIDNPPSPFFGTYNVSSDPPGLIVGTPSVDGNGTITITTSAAASGNYDLIIEHVTGGNCTPESETFPITVSSNGAFISPLYNQGMADLYIANNTSGATSIVWTLFDANGNVIGNPSPVPPTILILDGNNTPPAQVCVDVTKNGCITRDCVAGGTYSEFILGNDNVENAMKNNINVFPNPNTGEFTVSVEKVEKQASLTIIDMKGAVVSENQSLMRGANRITTKQLMRGFYVLLITVDGNTHAKKVEIID